MVLVLPLVVMLLVAAVIDARDRRIPNWLTVSMMLTGILQSVIFAAPVTWPGSLLGIGTALLAGLVLLGLGAFGGGDAKLLIGVGAWLGWWNLLIVIASASVVAMVMALLQAMRRGQTTDLLRNTAVLALQLAQGTAPYTEGAEQRLSTREKVLPYAVPVAASAITLLVWQATMLAS